MLTEVFEDDDDVFITVDHKSANSEPDLPADEYAKSTKIKCVYRSLYMGFNTIWLRLLNETHKCVAKQSKLWLFRQELRVSDRLLFFSFRPKFCDFIFRLMMMKRFRPKTRFRAAAFLIISYVGTSYPVINEIF